MVTNNSCDYSPTRHSVQVGGIAGKLADVTNGTTGQILTAITGASPTFQAPGTFSSVVQQVFTSNGTYTPTAGMKYCVIELVGGGGGSGGCATTSGSQFSSSAGGGGGGYARSVFSAATIGASQSVTIGAGGLAGTAGNNAGGTGGTTSVGAGPILRATGGGGGQGGGATSTFALYFSAGDGGVGNVGTVLAKGCPGHWGIAQTANNITTSGCGGGSVLGGGGKNVQQAAATPGGAYGGGAGGGSNDINKVDLAGAAGAPGVVIVTEFI